MKGIKLNNYVLVISILVINFFQLFSAQASYNKSKPMQIQTKLLSEMNGIKEYQFPNGLKVLLKQNHSIPLVTFSIWYKVGSRNETKGIYGLAHFLEHMMFKGTNKFKKGDISRIIQEHGGVFNAFTSSDGTAYYETISPKYLEKVIEIESDRMKGSLLDENELNLERTVVLSELEGDLNNPTSLLDQKLRESAYEVSPYKHPTIGYENEIKNVNSNIMRGFYKKFYNPNNATIVLAGDFNENKALELIEKYFANIQNDKTESFTIPKENKQNKEKRITVKRSGSFKILEIAYHIPEAKSQDIYPLNIIEEILVRGKNSRLNKALVEKGLATEVTGGAEANVDPGLFYILISLTPKATHKNVEGIVLDEIDKLIKDPPQEEEITAAKNRIKANYLFNLDGSFSQATNLGYFELINNWRQALTWTEEISKVTTDQILNSLKEYFQKENRTIGCFIPKIRKGEKYEAQSLTVTRTHNYKQKELIAESLESRNGKPFRYEKQKLRDGSDLLTYKNIDLPITYISGVIKGGSSLVNKEKEWDCQIISRTLEKGSKNYTKEQIDKVLDNIGSGIDFACDEESFKFSIASLNENLKQTLELFNDILLNPTFPKSEINIEKEKLIAEIIETKDSTQEIAKRRFSQIIYLKDHPYYSNDFDDDIKLIKNIDIDDLKTVHQRLIKDNKLTISITSNLENKELNSIIKDLEDNLISQNEKQEGQINIPDTLLRDTPKTESIFVKDKMQSDVFLGHAGNLRRTDPDFYKVHIANYVLGGSSLSSRLAIRVRDNAGLVYHINSYINASHGKGEFGIYFGSNNNNVDKAIELTKDELRNFVKNGITEEELNKAKASLIDSFVSKNLSTYRTIANTLAAVEFFDLGRDYINNYPQIINSLQLKEVNKAIKQYINPEKLNIVVAGEYPSKNKKK